MTAEPRLTTAQERYLAEIDAKPGRRYNGRARRSLEALKAAGMITYQYDAIPHAKGSGITLTEQYTCWVTQAGHQRVTPDPCRACTSGRGRHSCGLAGLQDMLRIGGRR